MSWTLRPAGEDDVPFLARVYASTREEELAATGWPRELKDAFLRSQFEAQWRHYRHNYPSAEFLVIVVGGEAAGRLFVLRGEGDIRVMDVALLPEHRGAGVGSEILGALMEEAARGGKKVSLHVEKNNPARRLYARLGFVPVGEHGIYDLVEWRQLKEI
jgi:ribosomal protein S18 acetylase RimI-like enzyme